MRDGPAVTPQHDKRSPLRRLLPAIGVLLTVSAAGTAAHGLIPTPPAPSLWSEVQLAKPQVASRRTFELRDPVIEAFGFDRHATPKSERPTGNGFVTGRYGLRTWELLPQLSIAEPSAFELSPAITAPLLGSSHLSLDGITAGARSAKKPCVKRPITFIRFGGESDIFSLTRCDGSLLPDAVDRLSVLARPTEAERPPLPLPEEPAQTEVAGEWVAHVKLLHPRLLWALQQVNDAFPWRAVYIISGYRPSSHRGMHPVGRAIDVFLMSVANERVYALCRKLPDMGCGYYPNNKFVHIDVRPQGSGKSYWIDTSKPGEPSNYVNSWPGVEAGDAPGWRGGE